MAEELDSNFSIFLPHVFTTDPVADIEKGGRFSCFVGELLDFFLIAQYRSKNRAEGSRLEWQRRLQRISSSASVSCVDLATSKEDEEFSCNGFIYCWPATSSRYQNDVRAKKPLEPTITSRGDIIFPLHVSLDALPAMTRRIRLSVNVWSPQLSVSYLSDGQDRRDFIDSICHDPEEDREVIQTAFRCHVNAVLPIVASPTVRCKYMPVGARHYLCVEVANSLVETMKIHHLRVHSTLDVTPQNITYINNTHTSSTAQRTFGLDVFPVTLDGAESEMSCIMLQPGEQNCCIFCIIYHENQTHHKSLEVSLTTSVTWSVDTLQSRDQMITTHYSMPVFNIRRSSVSLHAACPSIVVNGDRLQVKYTVTNMEMEDCNLFLIWMPDEDRSGACNVSTGPLVCLQPLIRIGCCASGSSHTVYVEFLAVEGGLHEVGKHMLCKQYHADIGEADFFMDTPDPRHMTTVSHSCQVYVMPAS